ncbi:leucyl aminopeptidase [Helicobacter sp. MIT 99-5507]|uniref:leucyl aminopeptidase n=1 Tax=Helicobacter sp. MIT 99-5507 TaxID=152489 RepID=UPI000E1F77EC|nr:leucyl aminopeptidase [Helicobacter sp. MIT 99-5507]RDU56695.1 leucyl aminopeptidase [Helicobacter sp. MIT 99-5507]
MSLNIKFTKDDDVKSDIEIVFIDQNLFKKLPKSKTSILSLQSFSAKDGEAVFLQSDKILYYGTILDDIDSIREAAAKAIRIVKKYDIKSLKIKGFENSDFNYALFIGILLGDYEFIDYKSKITKTTLTDIFIITKKDYKSELHKAMIVANSTNLARNIVNTPPQDCTPIVLADIAKKIAKDFMLDYKIGDVKFLQKEKMELILSVARASTHEPRFIELIYKPKKTKKRIVLVGKGLTYDSGGLSLKPADYMTTMKADKGGGCAVLGVMQAIAGLKPDIEVVGIIGATENMIGGNAYKPDDILRSREGITIEVKNTDAEGRLVLADCLSYAQDLKPDFIIDLATLTGACVVGLGEYTSGIMGYNKKLNIEFEKVASKSGELTAILPFNKHLEKLIDSKNADISNVSSTRYGGALTAGIFLGRFIREEYKDKWIHLDIAGPAFVEKEWDVNSFGASGIGVRSVIDFILKVANGA